MNRFGPARAIGPRAALLAASLLFAAMPAQRAPGQPYQTGVQISNPNWEILVTETGYSDLALDRRPGFLGREFLSGEWAAAVWYRGGRNPPGPIWLQRQWYYPDWVSNSDFDVAEATGLADPNNPFNAHGFPVYRSVVTNAELRITITYEMLDTTNGIAQGTTPRSAQGPGESLASDRYVFRQTYVLQNVAAEALNDVRLFQFLHGLEMSTAVYDERDYGGPMADYRYDLTLQGQSPGSDIRTGQWVTHYDTLAVHANVRPAAWEVGYYGREGVDNHVVGKPGVGVHLSVETNSLSGADWFSPPEEHWVSGALAFDLGTLQPNASVTNAVLLSLRAISLPRVPGFGLAIRNVKLTSTNALLIDFERTAGEVTRFVLRAANQLGAQPMANWETIPACCYPNPLKPAWFRFVVPLSAGSTSGFFNIQPATEP